MKSPKHIASLLAVAIFLWLVWSGQTKALLLSLGALSAVITVWIAVRMEIIDHESYPLELSRKLVTYWFWLSKEIVVSNFDVARRILSRKPGISSSIARVATGKRSNIGRAIYANSITLTPGTVAIDVGEDYILIHALTKAHADRVKAGDMARRVPDPGVPE